MLAAAALLCAAWLEPQAYACGAGIVETRLPYDLRGFRMNGEFHLADREGSGVVFPRGVVATDRGPIKVMTINGYRRAEPFFVGVTVWPERRAVLSIARSPEGVLEIRELGTDPFPDRSDAAWQRVDMEYCQYGSALRFWLIVLAAVGLGVAFSFRRRKAAA